MNRSASEDGGARPDSASPSAPRRPRLIVHWALFGVLAAGISALDLWSKAHIFDLLHVEVVASPAGGRPALRSDPPIVVIPNCFEIEASVNTGAFSGWFSGKMTFLTVLSAVALVAIVWFLWSQLRSPGPHRLVYTAAFGLLWAGAFGNLYDRALLGYVRDFVKWFVVIDGKPRVWPNFNVADSAICVGVSLILLLFLLDARGKPAKAVGEAAGGGRKKS